MASVRHCAETSLLPATWSEAGQVSLTLAQHSSTGGELSEEDEEEQMELSSEGWNIVTRRSRYGSGKKGTGVSPHLDPVRVAP